MTLVVMATRRMMIVVRERRADNVFCNLRSHLCSTCHNKNHSDTFQEHFSLLSMILNNVHEIIFSLWLVSSNKHSTLTSSQLLLQSPSSSFSSPRSSSRLLSWQSCKCKFLFFCLSFSGVPVFCPDIKSDDETIKRK